MSEESKEKRQHEQHHPHRAHHKHEHHKPDDERSVHPGWFLVLGMILVIAIVLGWTMSYSF